MVGEEVEPASAPYWEAFWLLHPGRITIGAMGTEITGFTEAALWDYAVRREMDPAEFVVVLLAMDRVFTHHISEQIAKANAPPGR